MIFSILHSIGSLSMYLSFFEVVCIRSDHSEWDGFRIQVHVHNVFGILRAFLVALFDNHIVKS